MLPEERQNMIVQIINETGSASVKDLSIRFTITEDSIRKDLTALQKRGLIRKTYGGAMRIEDDSQERYVSQRKGKYLLDKQKIAKKVLRLLKDGDLIFLDISTTNVEVAKLLKTSGLSLTIVTNMVDVMLTMAGDEFNKLYSLVVNLLKAKTVLLVLLLIVKLINIVSINLLWALLV